jgi:hypothetical protein
MSIIAALRKALAPRRPFLDAAGTKGWMTAFAKAQRHHTNHVHLAPAKWTGRSSPLHVAVLADLHVGSHHDDVARLRSIVGEVNGTAPQVILLLGDYVNMQPFGGGRVPPDTIAQILSDLSASHGVYGVLGNHDWAYDGAEITAALQRAGVIVLENAVVRVSHSEGTFAVAGLADDSTQRSDVAAVLGQCGADEPVLIAAHDPATFADLAPTGHIMVCGHTHGGQITVPGFGPVVNASRAPLRWSTGHVVENDNELYVCRGLGTSTLPLRINCPPEVTHLWIGGTSDPSA